MIRKALGFTVAGALCLLPQLARSNRAQSALQENELADLNRALASDMNASLPDHPVEYEQRAVSDNLAAEVDEISAATNAAVADLEEAAAAASAAYRFYRTSVAGTGSQTIITYMDSLSIRDLNGYRRGWETAYLALPASGWPVGAHHILTLVEADCVQERTRTITFTVYSRTGDALRTIQPSMQQWGYAIPDTARWQTMRFICGSVPRWQFDGVNDLEADARRLLPRPQSPLNVPQRLRPRPPL